ncbi:MAG: metallopeptidase TldD-related protein, partial [Candidatus Thorarchaeota archaeon]
LVRDDRSFIPDSLDKIVASDVLEIRDDALMAAGIKSRPFDTEGVPSSCTDVISKGILKSYLHDSYTSNLAETKNTANAFRKSYENVPIISTSNLVISSGKGSLDDLVSEVSKGLLCLNSIDRPNEVTGELSAMAMEGFYIIDGTIQHPVKSTLFATTMQDLMLNTFRVGDDVRMTESIVSPSIIIDSVKVTSG